MLRLELTVAFRTLQKSGLMNVQLIVKMSIIKNLEGKMKKFRKKLFQRIQSD